MTAGATADLGASIASMQLSPRRLGATAGMMTRT